MTERTGLSAQLLRAWERRYSVVEPQRDAGGRRLYSDADVERLALLSSATRSGRSVASVVVLPTDELRVMVREDAVRASKRSAVPGSHQDHAVRAVRNLAPERLAVLLRRAVLSLGTIAFLEEVVAPLMVEIGREWQAERLSIAQEHAATAAVLHSLGSLIRDLELPDAAPTLVIATPSGERHAAGALMAAAAAAHDGWHVIWLGTDLPAGQIATAAAQGDAHIVALSVATAGAGLLAELQHLRQQLPPHIPLMIGGSGAGQIEQMDGLRRVQDLAHWRSSLRLHASKSPE